MIKEVYVLEINKHNNRQRMQQMKVWSDVKNILSFTEWSLIGRQLDKSKLGTVFQTPYEWYIIIENKNDIKQAKKTLQDYAIEYRESKISDLKKQILEQKDLLSDLYKLEQGR